MTGFSLPPPAGAEPSLISALAAISPTPEFAPSSEGGGAASLSNALPLYELTADTIVEHREAAPSHANHVGWRYLTLGSQRISLADVRVASGSVAQQDSPLADPILNLDAELAQQIVAAGHVAERYAPKGEYEARLLTFVHHRTPYLWFSNANGTEGDFFVSLADDQPVIDAPELLEQWLDDAVLRPGRVSEPGSEAGG